MHELDSSILNLFETSKNKLFSESEIATKLELHGKTKKHLSKILNRMVKSGQVVKVRNNRFSLGKEMDLVVGKLNVMRSGNAFVDIEQGNREVFVPARETGTALPGDRVMVRVSPHKDKTPGKTSGEVVRVVERVERDIVGTLKTTGNFNYVLPLDPCYQQSFYVPDSMGAKENDRVIVRFLDWNNRNVNPEAEIIEVLGPADMPSLDTECIIRHYGFRDKFPDAVTDEAQTVSGLADDPGNRKDIRDLHLITIDPETARDFDDALSLEKNDAGNRVLGVHIADVGHFVKKSSLLDREAQRRGNSIYLPDKTIPMLPEQLSNGICSLVPDKDRLAFSVFMTVDRDGLVTGTAFAKTIIRSKARLTYEKALKSIMDSSGKESRKGIEGIDKKTSRLLVELCELAQQFRKRRFAMHALDLEIPESKVVIGKDGRIARIETVENDISHQLVEECMVAANEAVARELANKKKQYISRLHEPPSQEKIEALTAELLDMGYEPGNLNIQVHLARFLRSIAGDPLAHHASVAVLKSMQRAVYSAEAHGHYGLAKSFYAHFTSPIRRYPDLVVHRQLADLLTKSSTSSYKLADLVSIAAHCSETEQSADEAERTIVEIKVYRFLEERLKSGKNCVFEGIIVKTTNYGMFVELLDLRVQGLVHIGGISNDFVRFDKQNETLRAGRKTYRAGMKVSVRLINLDFDQRKIDLKLENLNKT